MQYCPSNHNTLNETKQQYRSTHNMQRIIVFAMCNFLSVCHHPFGTESLSSTVLEIFSLKTRDHAHAPRHVPQVILYSVPCNVLHWTDNDDI